MEFLKAAKRGRVPWESVSLTALLAVLIFLIIFSIVITAGVAVFSGRFFLNLQPITTGLMTGETCEQAEFSIQRAYYDSGSGGLILDLFNMGEIPLEGFEVVVTYQDGSQVSERFETLKVPDNDIRNVMMPVNLDLEKVLVKSLECEEAKDLMSRNDIQGLGLQ